jgi:fructokinase
LTGGPRIGVDFGGTKIEGIILAGSRVSPEIVARRRIPTEASAGYASVLERTAAFVEGLLAEAGDGATVGVGMPGSVTRAGRVKNSNTVCLNGTPFRADLSRRLGRPLAFANDANCFALAEATMGAGRGHRLVFGAILGTGVGGGLVVGGEAREGPQSICGEWGHTILFPDSDRRCYCGQPGCVETYLAGPWIERHYRELGGAEGARLPEIVARRDQGDAAAARCVAAWMDAYGRAMANLINVLDPDAVVLGGGVSNAAPLYTEGREAVSRYLFSDELMTPILKHELGDSAGVFGAALLVP